MMFKDKNGVWHFVKQESRLFVREWGARYNFGVKIYVGLYHLGVLEGILDKLEDLKPFFTARENRLVEDLKREYLDRTGDEDECYTQDDVEHMIKRANNDA